jgi:hypothetical protein
MGVNDMFDKAKDSMKGQADKVGDVVDKTKDKVVEGADKMTGRKMSGNIEEGGDKGADMVKDAINKPK